MSEALVERWILATRPFSIDKFKNSFADSYSRAVGLDPASADQLSAALKAFDETEVHRILRTFAEEHFSEPALAAAVDFFESAAGRKYLAERETIMQASQDRVNKHLAECVRKAFGI